MAGHRSSTENHVAHSIAQAATNLFHAEATSMDVHRKTLMVKTKDIVKLAFILNGREKARKVGLELGIKTNKLTKWFFNWSKEGLEEGTRNDLPCS
jgi:hypothetical protein